MSQSSHKRSPSRTSIAHLPVELLDQIVSFCSQPTLLAISLVSTAFHAVAVKHLYQDIVWSDALPDRIVACCNTLLSRSDAALAVKSLFFDQSDRDDALLDDTPFEPPYYTLIANSLAALVNLRALELALIAQPYLRLIRSVTLPRLCTFASTLPLAPPLHHFLKRHPLIRDLALVPAEPYPLPSHIDFESDLDLVETDTDDVIDDDVESDSHAEGHTESWSEADGHTLLLPPLCLPALKHVRTTVEALPIVLACAPNVELVFLQHSFGSSHVQHQPQQPRPHSHQFHQSQQQRVQNDVGRQFAHDVELLARLAPGIRALQMTRMERSLDIVHVIAGKFPALETLAIYRPRPRTTYDVIYEMEALSKVSECLSSFKTLSYLQMQYSGHCHRRLELADLDHDSYVVSMWGTACSTLDACVMPTCVTWHRYQGHLWLPEQLTRLSWEWAAEKLWSGDYNSLVWAVHKCRARGRRGYRSTHDGKDAGPVAWDEHHWNVPNEEEAEEVEEEDASSEWQMLFAAFGEVFGKAWVESLVRGWKGLRGFTSVRLAGVVSGERWRSQGGSGVGVDAVAGGVTVPVGVANRDSVGPGAGDISSSGVVSMDALVGPMKTSVGGHTPHACDLGGGGGVEIVAF